MDEATQISERAFNYLATDIRGVNDFPKRMYLTCNPGGIGHNWVKRLFIDRNYRHDPDDPESWENPEDYTFIFATVEDNTYLMEGSPMYLKQLASLPDDLKRAYRYGDWDAIGGNYFKGFTPRSHAHAPFPIPKNWKIYRSFDYGLDMLACVWWAIDTDGRAWAFREYEKSGLIVQDAAHMIKENSLPAEEVVMTFAPPDMWNRQKDTGKTMADIFMNSGVPINKSDNNRIQGHMIMRNMMAGIPLHDKDVINLYPEGQAPEMLPALMFFSNLNSVISDIRDIQAAEDNPNDCAKQPHEVTHSVDAVRYFCINRTIQHELESHKKRFRRSFEDDEDSEEDYGEFMCGGEPTKGYMNA